jgi:hypothetical protein
MTVYSFGYSAAYEPPAPVIDSAISKTGQSTPEITLAALLDSGADAIIIPITVLQTTQARYVETRQMRGIVDTAYPVALYLVTVRIGPHTNPLFERLPLPLAWSPSLAVMS